MNKLTALLPAIFLLCGTNVFAENYLGLEPLTQNDEDVVWADSPTIEGEQLRVFFGVEDTGGQFTLIASRFNSGDRENVVVKSHKHNWHDETFYVISGSFLITNGDPNEKTVVKKGATVFSPRGTWHSWEALEENSEVLMFYTPGGFDKVWNKNLSFTPEQRKDKAFMAEFWQNADAISYEEESDQ